MLIIKSIREDILYNLKTKMKGNIQENIDNKEEVNSQLNDISVFAYLYWNGNWQVYAPFYNELS